jgi:hypothetical protein
MKWKEDKKMKTNEKLRLEKFNAFANKMGYNLIDLGENLCHRYRLEYMGEFSRDFFNIRDAMKYLTYFTDK